MILSFVMKISFSPAFVFLSNCQISFSPVVNSHSAKPSSAPSFRMVSGLTDFKRSGRDFKKEDLPLLLPPVIIAVQPLKSADRLLIAFKLDTVIFFYF